MILTFIDNPQKLSNGYISCSFMTIKGKFGGGFGFA